MAYLDDHPPNHQQFRCPRRERPSGIIGVHTAESHPDEAGPDTGAENVARFIQRRSSYGSYHLLADSDSIIQLVRFGCVAYHIGTHGLNEHTIGISAATQAAEWNSLSSGYRDAMVRNMARAAARGAKWLEDEYGITVPARRITLAQALRGERGFLAHGDADPGRRTDPGSTFPWDDFLSYYADENGDSMSWNEDLTPGTSGNDITNLAHETLPENWGRRAADLLGYAGSLHAFIRRTKFARPQMPDKSHWTLPTFIRWAYTHSGKSRAAAERAADLAEVSNAKLDALMDAQQGVDLSGIKAHIDERYAEASAERAEILALVAAVASGERDAAEVVDEIARRLSGGEADDDA